MRIKVEVGQIYRLNNHRYSHLSYRIISVGEIGKPGHCVEVNSPDIILDFRPVGSDGLSDITGLILEIKEKITPGIPLDPSLPILQAGHLQDRMRRRGK